ncbi:deubiquitinase OTUD6B-like [Glycine soja]|uniref:deubiquitinase OTUD6B-like n=1 Tax=Glycine soja TaxID=3848 RepID=UPI00103E576F|nr:deubiquitinase OTUD6B-like [Glycine soja]
MLRKEISQLQKKEVEIKKVAARERAALGYISGNGNEKSNLDSLVKAIARVSVTSQPEDTKVNKAKQRRDKKAQQEAEREQRIQAEQSDIISDRVIKNEKLENKFQASWLDCL